MSLELEFDLKELFERFWNRIAEKFPESFYEIPAIAGLRDFGYELKYVVQVHTDKKYKPNELREFLRYELLPWGHLGPMSYITEVKPHEKLLDVDLDLEKNGKMYIIPCQLYLTPIRLGIILEGEKRFVDASELVRHVESADVYMLGLYEDS
jgi:hypothetical protein